MPLLVSSMLWFEAIRLVLFAVPSLMSTVRMLSNATFSLERTEAFRLEMPSPLPALVTL